MSISIITVTYNSAGEIEDFIESVRAQKESIILWIIDNASTDNTVEIVSNLASRYSWIKLIASPINMGLAAANNMPIKKINSDFTAIINPDVILSFDALTALKNYLLQHDDVVAVAPINVYAYGDAHTSFHKNWTLMHLVTWRIFPSFLTRRIYGKIHKYCEQNVLFASGACILFRSMDYQAIEGYDPEYFLTVEDACDLCIRLRQGDESKRVVVTPAAQVTHLGARSSSGLPFIVLWHGARGSIYHFHKHHGLLVGILAYFIILFSILIRFLISIPGSIFSKQQRLSLLVNGRVILALITHNPLLIKISPKSNYENNKYN